MSSADDNRPIWRWDDVMLTNRRDTQTIWYGWITFWCLAFKNSFVYSTCDSTITWFSCSRTGTAEGLSVELCRGTSPSSPRYTMHVVDSDQNFGVSKKFGIFITPQGRYRVKENFWKAFEMSASYIRFIMWLFSCTIPLCWIALVRCQWWMRQRNWLYSTNGPSSSTLTTCMVFDWSNVSLMSAQNDTITWRDLIQQSTCFGSINSKYSAPPRGCAEEVIIAIYHRKKLMCIKAVFVVVHWGSDSSFTFGKCSTILNCWHISEDG